MYLNPTFIFQVERNVCRSNVAVLVISVTDLWHNSTEKYTWKVLCISSVGALVLNNSQVKLQLQDTGKMSRYWWANCIENTDWCDKCMHSSKKSFVVFWFFFHINKCAVILGIWEEGSLGVVIAELRINYWKESHGCRAITILIALKMLTMWIYDSIMQKNLFSYYLWLCLVEKLCK